MRRYIVPRLICVELRAEENIATGGCSGCCTEEEAAEYNLSHPDKPITAYNGS